MKPENIPGRKTKNSAFLVLVAALVCFAVACFAGPAMVNSFPSEDLVPLPKGVNVKCSHQGCYREATRAVRSVVAELNTAGSHLYSYGESSGAYCDMHSPTNAEIYPLTTFFVGSATFLVMMGLIAAVSNFIKERDPSAVLAREEARRQRDDLFDTLRSIRETEEQYRKARGSPSVKLKPPTFRSGGF